MSTVHSPAVSSESSSGVVPVRSALFSVFDKTGVTDLARAISERGGTLLASGGTAKALTDADLPVLSIEEYTGLAAGFGGRVKTLHPKIHAGILARRDVEQDLAELEEGGAMPIDLVCVNLYPFEETVAAGASEAERTEKIDVGGPTMIRAAAKNWRHVAVVCDIADVPEILRELDRNDGGLTLETRRRLAAKAFARTSSYDAAIRDDLRTSGRESEGGLPDNLTGSIAKVTDLRYGENPHQRAALYGAASGPGELPSGWKQLAGTELSFNNWIDLGAAAELALGFEDTVAVIVKHTNPCGVALGGSQREAWERALSSDPVSAFGGIAAFNRPLEGPTAEAMASLFLEVVVAPGFTPEAREALAKKKRLRLVEVPVAEYAKPRFEWRALPGGIMLLQDDPGVPARTDDWETASEREPTDSEMRDLEFGWKVAASVKSNAIVFVKDARVLGVGAGQMSRVDSVRIAIDKAREHGHDLEGSVVASDAFFPFADGPELALKAGATAIVQPGGSKRDADTLEVVNDLKAAMVFTKRRVFRH